MTKRLARLTAVVALVAFSGIFSANARAATCTVPRCRSMRPRAPLEIVFYSMASPRSPRPARRGIFSDQASKKRFAKTGPLLNTNSGPEWLYQPIPW